MKKYIIYSFIIMNIMSVSCISEFFENRTIKQYAGNENKYNELANIIWSQTNIKSIYHYSYLDDGKYGINEYKFNTINDVKNKMPEYENIFILMDKLNVGCIWRMYNFLEIFNQRRLDNYGGLLFCPSDEPSISTSHYTNKITKYWYGFYHN